MYEVERTSYTAYDSNVAVYMEKIELVGLSTEDKGSLEAHNTGSTFTCTDTGAEYVWSGSEWVQKGASIAAALTAVVGDLDDLETTEQGSIVGAINEVVASLA